MHDFYLLFSTNLDPLTPGQQCSKICTWDSGWGTDQGDQDVPVPNYVPVSVPFSISFPISDHVNVCVPIYDVPIYYVPVYFYVPASVSVPVSDSVFLPIPFLVPNLFLTFSCFCSYSCYLWFSISVCFIFPLFFFVLFMLLFIFLFLFFSCIWLTCFLYDSFLYASSYLGGWPVEGVPCWKKIVQQHIKMLNSFAIIGPTVGRVEITNLSISFYVLIFVMYEVVYNMAFFL